MMARTGTVWRTKLTPRASHVAPGTEYCGVWIIYSGGSEDRSETSLVIIRAPCSVLWGMEAFTGTSSTKGNAILEDCW